MTYPWETLWFLKQHLRKWAEALSLKCLTALNHCGQHGEAACVYYRDLRMLFYTICLFLQLKQEAHFVHFFVFENRTDGRTDMCFLTSFLVSSDLFSLIQETSKGSLGSRLRLPDYIFILIWQ